MDEPRRTAEQAAGTPWARGLARWGLLSKGFLYGAVGILAIKVALLGHGKTPERDSALRAVAGQPFGKLLLAIVAIGLAAYAAWRLTRAALGHTLEGDDEGVLKRLGDLARGVFYGAICVATTTIIVGASGEDRQKEDRATAFVLDLPAGPLIVAAVGVGFLAAGVFNAYRAVTCSFRKHLKLRKMSDGEEKAFTVVGAVGHAARAVVWTLIGVFLVRAAYQYDAQETVGIDGALAEVAHGPYGTLLLGVVAAGLFAYGLYCLVEARYREV